VALGKMVGHCEGSIGLMPIPQVGLITQPGHCACKEARETNKMEPRSKNFFIKKGKQDANIGKYLKSRTEALFFVFQGNCAIHKGVTTQLTRV
jgi:hypothetical protein